MKTLTLLDLVTRLVSFNTISKECVVSDDGTGYKLTLEYIAEFCEKNRFKITSFGNGKKTNLVAVKGPSAKPILALSGHTDTVSYNPKSWKDNVFTVAKKGKRYQGLGITDMKLFLAMAMLAASSIPDEDLSESLALYFTHTEELGCKGVKLLLSEKEFIPAKNIIVGEPTLLVPMRFQKGYMFFRINITRKSNKGCSHSSDPRDLVNVITIALPQVIDGLEKFGLHLRKFKDVNYDPNYATMNIGNIVMGANAAKNIIPGEIKLECDIRFMHGQDSGTIFNLLESTIEQIADNINRNRSEDKRINIQVEFNTSPTLPLETSKSCNLVEAAETIFDRKAEGVSYSSEATIFSHRTGADTIILGPGSIRDAHQDFESIDENFLDPIHITHYVELIRHFCCKGGKS